MPVFTRRAGADDLDLITPLFDGYRRFYGQAGDPDLARDFLSQRLSRNESTLFLAQDERGEALGFAQLVPGFFLGTRSTHIHPERSLRHAVRARPWRRPVAATGRSRLRQKPERGAAVAFNLNR